MIISYQDVIKRRQKSSAVESGNLLPQKLSDIEQRALNIS